MGYTKEHVRRYVGRWVHCESIYGVHYGMVHRVLHDGIVQTACRTMASNDRL